MRCPPFLSSVPSVRRCGIDRPAGRQAMCHLLAQVQPTHACPAVLALPAFQAKAAWVRKWINRQATAAAALPPLLLPVPPPPAPGLSLGSHSTQAA